MKFVAKGFKNYPSKLFEKVTNYAPTIFQHYFLLLLLLLMQINYSLNMEITVSSILCQSSGLKTWLDVNTNHRRTQSRTKTYNVRTVRMQNEYWMRLNELELRTLLGSSAQRACSNRFVRTCLCKQRSALRGFYVFSLRIRLQLRFSLRSLASFTVENKIEIIMKRFLSGTSARIYLYTYRRSIYLF